MRENAKMKQRRFTPGLVLTAIHMGLCIVLNGFLPIALYGFNGMMTVLNYIFTGLLPVLLLFLAFLFPTNHKGHCLLFSLSFVWAAIIAVIYLAQQVNYLWYPVVSIACVFVAVDALLLRWKGWILSIILLIAQPLSNMYTTFIIPTTPDDGHLLIRGLSLLSSVAVVWFILWHRKQHSTH